MIYINARFLTQPITGVQRYAIELSLLLKDMDTSIQFLCPHNILHKDIAKKLGAKVIGKKNGHAWEQIDLPLFLNKQGKPLLINLCNTAPAFYKNKILVLHDIIYKLFPKSCSFSFRLWYLILIPKIVKNSLSLITVSEFSKKEISSHFKYPLNKIEIVYNAVSDRFRPNKNSRINQTPYLLAVSSVNYHKNYSRVIEAFTNLYKSKKYDIKLFIIGGTNQCFSKEYYDTENIPISFLGRVNDNELIKLYQNALAFIFPSIYEGFGIPPIEAQACGCPVVSSNTSAMPEILKDSVLYFDPLDILDIEKAMDIIITDQTMQESLISKGFYNVDRFSWEDSAQKLYLIIKKYKNID